MDTPEAKTRKNLIDPGFRKAGWNLEDLTQVVQEFPIPFKTDTKKIPNVTLSILQRMYDNRYVKFIQFIKYILGMEKIHSFSEVVAKEFENFICHHNNLNTNQLRFLDILRHFIIDKGKVSRKDLVEAPFIQVHPNGISGVFKPLEINEIVELTERIIA